MKWIFPMGVALTFVGMLSELLLRGNVFNNFRVSYIIDPMMILSLLGGALLIIAGSIIDVKRLAGGRAIRRSLFCLSLAIISIVLMIVHHWGFDDAAIALIIPAFSGFVGSFVLFLFSKG